MKKIYLSFLGTNDYEPCTYTLGNQRVENVRFVQEATLSLSCKNWSADDRIFILVTDEAYKNNWVDNGHSKRAADGLCEGLENRIQKIGLAAEVELIRIQEMKSEKEMWRIFQSIFDLLDPQSFVVFDITHAYRSIPMLAIVVLNYAKTLKKINLAGIYYGAFEVLGPLYKVKKMPLEEREAPIWDLTSFDTLLEWSAAIDGFLKSGNAKKLQVLADESIQPILRDRTDLRDTGNAVRRLANNLAELGDVISTCRCQNITKTTQHIRQNLAQCGEGKLIPAFQPLLDHLRPRMEQFSGDDILDGVQAARWCLEHQLVQQGFTILQETLITHLIRKAGEDPLDRDIRSIVTSSVSFLRKGEPPEQWYGPAGNNKATTERCMEVLESDELVELMTNITNDRNDLNHGGYNESPQSPGKFYEKLVRHLKQVESYLQRQGT